MRLVSDERGARMSGPQRIGAYVLSMAAIPSALSTSAPPAARSLEVLPRTSDAESLALSSLGHELDVRLLRVGTSLARGHEIADFSDVTFSRTPRSIRHLQGRVTKRDRRLGMTDNERTLQSYLAATE